MQTRIITRVSPKLESYFEDSFLEYERQHQYLMNQFKILKENPNHENFLKWMELLKKYNKVYVLIKDIQISRQIIEDILQRLED